MERQIACPFQALFVTFLRKRNITHNERVHRKKMHQSSISAKIHSPDPNHPSSKVSKTLPTKNRGILGLITYCSNHRIHLIGSKIVQSITSPGRAKEGRRDWSSISPRACMCVSERNGREMSFVCVLLSH